jgi:glycosyltransferase involved in cell wall biosynthesis
MGQRQRLKIGIFETNPGFGGGNVYQKMIIEALSKTHTVRSFKVFPQRLSKMRRPRILMKIMYLNMGERSINLWIRNPYGVMGMGFHEKNKPHIALFFHRDYDAIPNQWLSRILDLLFWKNVWKCDEVVVISQYWKDFLEARGLPQVRVISYGFDLSNFHFQPDNVAGFKKRFSLTGKPIIYLGNCQETKGVREAYLSLKDSPYHLVTSGTKEVDIPVPNLELNYEDYLLLLRSASVVLTMSKFLEGWNITAHEAMLCRTPVVGSGKGGMRELLEGGHQIICQDFSTLPGLVEYAMKNREALGEKGFNFAKQFTKEKFESEWLNLIEQYHR